MPLLSEEEREEIRQSLIEPNEEILSETATILRRTLTPDEYGSEIESFAEVGTAPCMLSRAGQPETYTDEPHGGGVGPQQLWKISFLDTADLQRTDRVQIGERVFECVGDVGLGTYSILNRTLWKEVLDE
jgi:hypothetical protein